MVLSNQIDSIVNHEEENHIDEQLSNNQLTEAQEQIALLREHLNQTNGK